jgi:hypothetical protein
MVEMTADEIIRTLRMLRYGRLTFTALSKRTGISRTILYTAIRNGYVPPKHRQTLSNFLQTAQREGYDIPSSAV